MNHKNKYIAIEGNIGAGKTSLCRQLADELSASLLLENFDENPFLRLFYENPTQYALSVELFFMTERHEQMKSWLLAQSLSEHQYYIADYIFSKTLLFANRTLNETEWSLFQRVFHALNAHIPQPDLLVYLHRPVEELLQNIRLRNRNYEQNISAEYLKRIETAYTDFFASLSQQETETQIPVLFLDVSGLDFVHQPDDYQIVKTLIQAKYPTGVHHRRALTNI
jgi:deoxyguanosine kinase